MCVTNTKVCVTCDLALSLDKFYRYEKNTGGLRHSCKRCMKESSKKWHADNPLKKSGYRKRWEETNLEKANEIRKKWRAANRAKVRGYENKWATENREAVARKSMRSSANTILTLSNSYVRDSLGLSKNAAPESLIDAHRQYLKIKRLIKETK